MTRPASVKWALLFFVVTSIGGWLAAWGFMEQRRILSAEFHIALDSQAAILPLLIQPFLHTVALILFVAGGRKPLAYWTGVVFLGLTCCYRAVRVFSGPLDAGAAHPFLLFVLWATLLVLNVFVLWLFYRFTFGRPSRLYYRVAKP